LLCEYLLLFIILLFIGWDDTHGEKQMEKGGQAAMGKDGRLEGWKAGRVGG